MIYCRQCMQLCFTNFQRCWCYGQPSCWRGWYHSVAPSPSGESLNSRWSFPQRILTQPIYLCLQVQDVVDANPGVTKISFLSHSLGGLVSRYAIGQLYAPQGGRSLLQERASSRFRNGEILVEHAKVGEAERVGDHDATTVAAPLYGSIAGLEPINFITVATPHLGSKGNRHVR